MPFYFNPDKQLLNKHRKTMKTNISELIFNKSFLIGLFLGLIVSAAVTLALVSGGVNQPDAKAVKGTMVNSGGMPSVGDAGTVVSRYLEPICTPMIQVVLVQFGEGPNSHTILCRPVNNNAWTLGAMVHVTSISTGEPCAHSNPGGIWVAAE